MYLVFNFKHRFMNMKNISYCLLAGLIFGSCSGKVYEQTDNGVIVKVQQKGGQDTRLVRFQVMGDKLIHVSATPESKFTDSKSLVVVPQEKQTPFTVSQQGLSLIHISEPTRP